MNTSFSRRHLNHGFSLIELLIAMTITLVMVIAASLVYLSVRETESAQSKASDSIETGTFALQLIGRDLAQAGAYPIVMPPTTMYFPQGRWLETYPPTNWITELPTGAYQSAVFGCDGGKFNSTKGTCDPTSAISPYRSAPDSIVINYFSTEARNAPVGNRKDCTGADTAPSTTPAKVNDPVNNVRRLNSVPNVTVTPPVATSEDFDLPPQLPLFISNRYGLNDVQTEVSKQNISTLSLACNGNGSNGSTPGAGTTNTYQPIIVGVEDMQITYGVFAIDPAASSLSLTPVRFIKASEVAALGTQTYEYKTYLPWDRVSAVRICFMTRTLGDNVRIKDGVGKDEQRTYLDCTDDVPQKYALSDTSIRKRHVQVFPLRNHLTQVY
jgi:type IV pilus assembly protein PilW